jgi:hypothetical protein
MKTKLMIAALLACLVPAAATAARPDHPGKQQHQNQQQQQQQQQQRGILYVFTGALKEAPSATGFTVTVEGGNRPALKAMIGQSAEQTFSYDAGTEFLLWTRGIPTVVPASALHAGDWVRVNVRAPRNASLAEIEATPPTIVGDRVNEPQPPNRPLFLFRGTLTAVGASSVTVHVTGGNRHALRLLVGQSADQTFAFDAGTICLLWQGKVPTVITPSQLKVGDRFVVRIRADRGSTLAEVEATPANHLGDREPPAPQA